MLVIDFETRSRCNLLTQGAYKYAADPSTEMLCLAWSLDGEDGVISHWGDLSMTVVNYIMSGGLVAAFNAQFDRLIWRAVAPGLLKLPMARWYCLAAQCRVNALPGNLNDAGRALFGRHMKDIRGPQLIKALSIPQPDGTFNESPALMKEMREYCLQDVRLSVDVMNSCRLMTPNEHHEWLVNEYINDRGVEVDLYLAELATKYASQEAEVASDALYDLTEGTITKHTQVQRIKELLVPNMSADALALCTVNDKVSLDKQARERLLTDTSIELDPLAIGVLTALDNASAGSVSKFKTMAQLAGEGDRVRGAFVYAGASQTLRYTSRGLQLHNFRRDALSAEETEANITLMEAGTPLPDPMQTLAKMLRPAIVPRDGYVFVVGDWSSIEAMTLPWLANAKARLNKFVEGVDIYQDTSDAMRLNSRQLGKVVELSMGYGGANGAFDAMAKNYGVKLPAKEVTKLVEKWRDQNRWAVGFWDSLELAAKRAVRRPGDTVIAGDSKVSYTFYPNLIGGTLVCHLPCGGFIQYPRAAFTEVTDKFGEKREALTAMKASWTPATGEKEWPRVALWRGLLAENVTQAVCGSILRQTLTQCDDKGFYVVAHVHDEIVVESTLSMAPDTVEALGMVMSGGLPWTTGLPLRAKPTIMTRYGK